MADLKLKLLVNLTGGMTLFKAGQVFEGTLDTFPKLIRDTYLSGKPNRIQVLVDPKGKEVPPKVESATGVESAKVVGTQGKKVVDASAGQTGKPVPDVGEEQKSFDGRSVEVKDDKKVSDANGDSGTAEKAVAKKLVIAKKKKAAVKRSPKVKPKAKKLIKKLEDD